MYGHSKRLSPASLIGERAVEKTLQYCCTVGPVQKCVVPLHAIACGLTPRGMTPSPVPLRRRVGKRTKPGAAVRGTNPRKIEKLQSEPKLQFPRAAEALCRVEHPSLRSLDRFDSRKNCSARSCIWPCRTRLSLSRFQDACSSVPSFRRRTRIRGIRQRVFIPFDVVLFQFDCSVKFVRRGCYARRESRPPLGREPLFGRPLRG